MKNIISTLFLAKEKGIVHIDELLPYMLPDTYEKNITIIKEYTNLDLSNPTKLQNLDKIEIDNINSRMNQYINTITNNLQKLYECEDRDEKPTHIDKNFIYYLAFVFVVLSFTCVMICLIMVSEENSRYIDIVLVFILGSVLSPIVNYFFGAAFKNISTTKRPSLGKKL
jgi:lipopolysaccharide export LptBFGC system permease protein LptF